MSEDNLELSKVNENESAEMPPKAKKKEGKNPDSNVSPKGKRNKPSIVFSQLMAWRALGMISWTIVVGLSISYIYLGTQLIVFLQPVLLPIAVAGVLAYLLNPVVNWIEQKLPKLGRTFSVSLVMLLMCGIFVGLIAAVIPPIIEQGNELIQKRESIMQRGILALDNTVKNPAVKMFIDQAYDKALETSKQENIPVPNVDSLGAVPATPAPKNPEIYANPKEISGTDKLFRIIEIHSGSLTQNVLKWFGSTSAAFLGMMGYVVGLVMVPIFAFYFLLNSRSIKENWPTLLPIRNSTIKDEIVETLTDINQYLVSFFRGQMLVSIIDGVLTGLLLHFILDLPYAFVIGAALAILGIIPYVGFVVTLVPTLAIAWFQWGDGAHLFYVSLIFFGVNQLDSWIIQPKVIGDSVGLHPMTVIFSVLFWSFLLGGLLGALLAVPLTAGLKVIFARYVWQNWKRTIDSSDAISPTST